MVVLFQVSGYNLGSGPAIARDFGYDLDFWLSIANDSVSGQTTGSTVKAHVFGSDPTDDLTVPYGVFLTKHFRGKRVEIPVVAGAFVEVIVAEEKINASPQTIQATAVTAVVSGTVTAATGLNASAYSNGGAAPNPGTVYVTLIGTGGEPTMSRNGGAAEKINGGSVLAVGSSKVFGPFPVAAADTLTFAAATYDQGSFQPAGS